MRLLGKILGLVFVVGSFALAAGKPPTSVPAPVPIVGGSPSKTKASVPTLPAGRAVISKEAYDLIVQYECGGQVYYTSRLSTPTWPGGASGVTIGIGYDLGYNTVEQIRKDWAHLGSSRVNQLVTVAGLKGQVAKAAVPRVKNVKISWAEALAVFENNTIPRFGNMTHTAFQNLNSGHPHEQGALVSIVFNRGASMSGDSRREMRSIRDTVKVGKWEPVPKHILDMRRLWVGKGLDGLLKRRIAEAALAKKGRELSAR
jgi:GH24 family phage-related lysozyme (muramidase)